MPTNDSYVGLLTFLLPYVDQSPIFNQIPTDRTSLELTNQPVWYSDAATYAVAQTRIPGFVCPSTDPCSATDGIFARFNIYPRGLNGLFEVRYLTNAAGATPVGRSNYLGSAGYMGNVDLGYTVPLRGLFGNRSKLDFRDCVDGTSTSLLIGESIGQKSGTALKYSHPWIGTGFLISSLGFLKLPQVLMYQQFSSEHSGIVHFCMADGAVRAISTNIDFAVFVNLGGIAEGNVVGVSHAGNAGLGFEMLAQAVGEAQTFCGGIFRG